MWPHSNVWDRSAINTKRSYSRGSVYSLRSLSHAWSDDLTNAWRIDFREYVRQTFFTWKSREILTWIAISGQRSNHVRCFSLRWSLITHFLSYCPNCLLNEFSRRHKSEIWTQRHKFKHVKSCRKIIINYCLLALWVPSMDLHGVSTLKFGRNIRIWRFEKLRRNRELFHYRLVTFCAKFNDPMAIWSA